MCYDLSIQITSVLNYYNTRDLGSASMDMSFKEENWKEVVDHPDYLISNHGRIYSKRTSKLLKPGKQNYLSFVVCVNNKRKTLNVHREVAKAFIGPYPVDMQVAHLDGNAHNNNVNNLKYVTAKINQNHRKIHGTDTKGIKNGRSVLTPEIVKLIKARYIPQKMGAPSLAKEFGVTASTIYRIIKGESWI